MLAVRRMADGPRRATERDLARVEAQVGRKNATLRDAAEIGLAVGAILNKRKMAKHFVVTIRDGHLSWHRRLDQIAAEARLDGIYVIRTSMPAEHLNAAETVQAYKDLSHVERAFRSLKSVDLDIRPIRHWTADRVRAHVFLCMLAYHVEWHLRQALAPLLFHDTDLAAAKAERTSPVAATEPSDAVTAKKITRRSADGQRVMSFADLVAHLGTLVRNTMRAPQAPLHTPLQTNRSPGGCLRAPRARSCPCPVTNTSHAAMIKPYQSLARSMGENFGLEWHAPSPGNLRARKKRSISLVASGPRGSV